MLSPLAARKAEKLGYTKVKVFHAGLPAWKKAGHPVVSNIQAIEQYNKADASYILIDLRPKNQVEQGHIPKAVELPSGGLDALKDQFPKYKNAAVILYNQDGNIAAAQDASKKISGWGYKQVSILAGGLNAWQKAGKELAKGAGASKIAYVRKLAPGEMDVEAFKAMIGKPAAGDVILDVRLSSEAKDGTLPNALTIPLDELEQRLSELPKDKTLLIHCSTGARAEMAYNLLKKAGFNAKYVKAKVNFDKEKKGAYTVEE